MKHLFFIILFFITGFVSKSQEDWTWWNEQHGWETGDPGWRNWTIMSAGYFGPNALPVPEVKRGFLSEKTEFEITASNQFHSDDPTQDISGRVYIPFAKGKIAVEVYGVLFEY